MQISRAAYVPAVQGILTEAFDVLIRNSAERIRFFRSRTITILTVIIISVDRWQIVLSEVKKKWSRTSLSNFHAPVFFFCMAVISPRSGSLSFAFQYRFLTAHAPPSLARSSYRVFTTSYRWSATCRICQINGNISYRHLPFFKNHLPLPLLSFQLFFLPSASRSTWSSWSLSTMLSARFIACSNWYTPFSRSLRRSPGDDANNFRACFNVSLKTPLCTCSQGNHKTLRTFRLKTPQPCPRNVDPVVPFNNQ